MFFINRSTYLLIVSTIPTVVYSNDAENQWGFNVVALKILVILKNTCNKTFSLKI